MTLPISASHKVACSEHHRPLTRGISTIFSPVPPRFGGFLCPVLAHLTRFPRYSWCGFVSLGGFLRPIHKISKDFLTRETFFQKYGANFKGHQGLRLAGAPGGWVAFVLFRPAWVGFRPCPPVPPASCPVHLQTERDRAKRPPFSRSLCGLISVQMDCYTAQVEKMALRA